MPNTLFDQWFIDRYDEYVSSRDSDSTVLEESRAAVAEQYAEAVEAGELERETVSVQETGRRHFNRVIGKVRESRRAALRKELDYLVDCIRDYTVLGTQDPRFGQAFPIGDGSDKTLGSWSFTDWETASTVREIESKVQAIAAREFKHGVEILKTAMIERGALVTRDVLDSAGIQS